MYGQPSKRKKEGEIHLSEKLCVTGDGVRGSGFVRQQRCRRAFIKFLRNPRIRACCYIRVSGKVLLVKFIKRCPKRHHAQKKNLESDETTKIYNKYLQLQLFKFYNNLVTLYKIPQ